MNGKFLEPLDNVEMEDLPQEWWVLRTTVEKRIQPSFWDEWAFSDAPNNYFCHNCNRAMTGDRHDHIERADPDRMHHTYYLGEYWTKDWFVYGSREEEFWDAYGERRW